MKWYNPRRWVDKLFPKIPVLNLWYKWVTKKELDLSAIREVGEKLKCQIMEIENGYAGTVEFETHGITDLPKNKETKKGGVEKFFFDAVGSNIKRFSLYHVAGRGRSGRVYIASKIERGHKNHYDTKECGAFTDDLPGWHKWTIHWGDARATVLLDGEGIDSMPCDFHGVVKKVFIGGCSQPQRNFYGHVRNIKINGVSL